jgi:hypothetical protein
MLAAGWGGSGTVQMEMGVRSRIGTPMALKRSLPAAAAPISSYGADAPEDFELEKPDRFIDRLDKLHTGLFTPFGDVATIRDLEARGVPEELIEMLEEFVDGGMDEKTVVTLFLYLLSQQKRIKKKLDRSTRRALAKAYKQLPEVPEDVQQRVGTSIATHLQYMGY